MKFFIKPIWKSKIYNAFWVFIWGLIINATITIPVFFLSGYLNPKTYQGHQGHNDGIVTMFVTIPFWIFFCIYKYKRTDKYSFYAYCLNLFVNLGTLTYIAILEL